MILEAMAPRSQPTTDRAKVERGTVAGRVHEYMRAKWGQHKSPVKEMVRHYGWGQSKCRHVFGGAYQFITADDLEVIGRVDGAGAALRLLGLTGGAVVGAEVEELLGTALSSLMSAKALMPLAGDDQ